jgi:hypothetical protein
LAQISAVPVVSPTVGAAPDADTVVRTVLFIGMYLAVWISFHPFQSLAEPPQTVTEAGDRVNQIAFSALFLALATWTYFHEPQRLLLLVRPIMVVALLWCAASVIFSWEPALAARRLTFTVMVMGMAAMVLLLPKDVRQFSDMMAAVVLIVLALCYLGLVLAPQLTIHQATDFVEPEHAGEWRGIFNHKNMAGVTMVLFIFVGMFVARARSFGLGALIVVLSSVFLGFTGSKTAIGILPLTLILSAIVTRTRRPALAIALVLVEPTHLLPVYRAAWLSFCDSRILRVLAWLEGRLLPLVTGSDLVAALLSALNGSDAPSDGRRLLIVGPRAQIATALRAAYPKLEFEILPAARPRRRCRIAACRRSRLRR